MIENDIVNKVEEYYKEKLLMHGPIPQGVDWKDLESQSVRFAVLRKLFLEEKSFFSLADLGCGYGAFYDFLQEMDGVNLTYYGYDIAVEMIDQAIKQHALSMNTRFIHLQKDMLNIQPADYFIASGIFNVKLAFG